MGFTKWLGLSASQPVGHSVRGDEVETEELLNIAHPPSQQQRRRHRLSKTSRRHTAWDNQQRERITSTYAPSRHSLPFDTGPDLYTPAPYYQLQQRFSSPSSNEHNADNDALFTMVTAMQSPVHKFDLDLEDSDVSIGADDDDFVASPLPMSGEAQYETTTMPLSSEVQRHIVNNSDCFSWMNVLGQSISSEAGQSVVTKVANEKALKAMEYNAQLEDQEFQNAALDTGMALRPQDDGMGVVMQGWLEKCGQHFKTWNWRFFVLRNDGVLSYYTDETLKKMKGSIDIGHGSKADVSVQSNPMEKNFVFLIATPQRNLMISAPSQRMMIKWLARLHVTGAVRAEQAHPFHKSVRFCARDTKGSLERKHVEDLTSYIHMEGFLLKRGQVTKRWKNYFFRVEKGKLRYYTENQSELKGSVPLKDTIVSPGITHCSDGRKYYFVLTSKDGKSEMHLNAHDEKSMHLWIEALQEAQTALDKTSGKTNAVSGLSLVVKRAEEIPLGKIEVLFKRPGNIDIEMQKRTEALIVTFSEKIHGIAVGSQLISIEGRGILRKTCAESRQILRACSFPLQLEFLLPPYKRGVLVKKSRSGFENWKKRVIVVKNGDIHYFKQVSSYSAGKKTPAECKYRKSFSLYGCYLNLVEVSGHEMCILVARSPSDKLVLQASTEEERIEWASVIYCSIRMVSQGITSGHIEALQLEHLRPPLKRVLSDINGSFQHYDQLEF